MRTQIIAEFIFITLLVLTGSVYGQSTSTSESLQDTLFNQEHDLASAERRQDKSFFQERLDDKLIYVAYNGLVFTKAKIVDSLNYIDVSRYTIRNMKFRSLGPDAGLVTYDLLLNGDIAGHDFPKKQYTSSVWLKRHDHWVLIFHQSTPADH